MKYQGECYLVLEPKRYGWLEVLVRAVRKAKPRTLKAGQVAVKLKFTIDSAAFDEPTACANISIPLSAVVPALDVSVEEHAS